MRRDDWDTIWILALVGAYVGLTWVLDHVDQIASRIGRWLASRERSR